MKAVENRKQLYKGLYERVRGEQQFRDVPEQEVVSLHQQLDAVLLVKNALHEENNDLRAQLEAAQQRSREESKQAACIICMDNLANIACLPCKHSALCSYCGMKPEVTHCPICRATVENKMQIYTP